MAGEVIIQSVEDFKTQLDQAKDKKEFLKKVIDNENNKKYNKEAVIELAPRLLKKSVSKYHLTYDAFGEGIEPIYFWILDFMKDRAPGGLGLKVAKGAEDFEASASSAYLGEMGARKTQMQAKTAEYLGAINQVIKSIVQLLYDLREFEMRIDEYNDAKSKDEEKRKSGLMALKAIWMDQVDMKKGRGSINGLSQDLRFVTLRDAFFEVETKGNLTKDLDLNDRVKRILKMKLDEFKIWKKRSEAEIRKRYKIERAYLKSQKGTLHLYINWVKPYIRNERKLRTKSSNSPNIVHSFSNMETTLSLFGFKEIKPGKIHDSYTKVDLGKKYYAVIEAKLNFRSLPQTVAGQGGRHYVHGGRTDIEFKGYFMDEVEIEAIKNYELHEDIKFIEEYFEESMEAIEEEIDKYINPPAPKKEEKTKQTHENPFKGSISGLKDIFFPFATSKNKKTAKKEKYKEYVEGKLKTLGKKEAQNLNFVIYNLYKKTHGMASY